jgi:hypothetical protein
MLSWSNSHVESTVVDLIQVENRRAVMRLGRARGRGGEEQGQAGQWAR